MFFSFGGGHRYWRAAHWESSVGERGGGGLLPTIPAARSLFAACFSSGRSITKILFAMALLLCCGAARANRIDPSIVVNNAVGCRKSYSCVPITGLTFGFATPSGGSGVLHFTNMSGVNWTSLILTEVGVPAISVTCSSNLFSCTVVRFGKNGAKMILQAFGSLPGVRAGKSFEISFSCKGDDCLPWPSDLQFDAVANSVAAEPGALTLLVTGLGLIFTGQGLRRNWRRKQTFRVRRASVQSKRQSDDTNSF
jgi:hypothetical protein